VVTAVLLLASERPGPVAIVVICAVVGIVDLRRRRETMLWENLGVSTLQLASLFMLVAAIGELLLALSLR
jgi:lipopolysaccharide export LptBFGC system permease protein LptF